MTVKELYEQDIVLWTARNAELLRAGRLEEADLEHIAEEIEDLGIRRSGRAGLATVGRRASPPRGTTFAGCARGLPEEPSCRGDRRGLQGGSGRGRSRLPESSFPTTCPFTVEQILDEEFFPE
jgi:hypothetical protein